MNAFYARLKEFLDTDRGVLVLLGVLTLVSFGIFVPFTGFYWDDWIWKFFSSAYSSDYLLWQPVDRPLAGTLHILLNTIFGDDPLNWQLGNLFFRWCNAAGFYFLMRRLFPNQINIPAILSIVFLVFPLFSEQWISIAFIHHLVPMALLWLSFILMFDAVDAEPWGWRFGLLGSSILLALLVMLTTEYFYGIEALRVVLLFYYLYRQAPQKKIFQILWRTIKFWWPYAVIIVFMVLWRAGLGTSEGATYSVNLSRLFADGIPSGVLEFFSLAANGIYAAIIVVGGELFAFPPMAELGVFKTVLFYFLVGAGFVFLFIEFHRLLDREAVPGRAGFELIGLGLAGLLAGGLPFWVAGLQYEPRFPGDRLGLPLIFGASFLIVGLILLLSRFRWLASGMLALIAALSIGANFLDGAEFAKSWADQQNFWGQFVTRVPDLEPGSAVIAAQLPPEFMSDISFMMTLNWLYDQDPSEEGLQYGLFFSDSRHMLEFVSESMPLVYDRRMVKFESNIENSLVISYNQNSCLHVFDAREGDLNPGSQHVAPRILPFADQELIITTSDQFSNWPEFFDPITEESWCHYYQLAELAIQRGEHTEVVRLGDQVFSQLAIPKKAWELAPFIEGYGFSSQWQKALDLSQVVVDTDLRAKDLLCAVWARIEHGTPESEAKHTALTQLELLLSCEEQ